MKLGVTIAALSWVVILLSYGSNNAHAQSQCAAFTLYEIADAIKKSPYVPATEKSRSCMWGGAARAESGGKPCAYNANNFGVLQLSRANVENLGLTPAEYMAETLQEQVDGWAQAGAAQNNKSRGFGLIDNDITKSLKFGGTMEGSLAACSQFGGVVCNNDIDIVESGLSLPIKNGTGAIRCKNSTCNHGTANQDGNGETIVSWGLAIQTQIYNAQCAD